MRVGKRLFLCLAGILGVFLIIEVSLSIDPNQILSTWGTQGSEEGQFSSPEGIAINASGDVFVVDTGNNRVQVFNSTGTFVREWGIVGIEDGQFQAPHGIALDKYGRVYIVDTGNNRIQVFSSTGQFLQKWGSLGTGNSQFNMPWGIAIDTDEHVYVTDTNNDRIQAFSLDGSFWRLWGNESYRLFQKPYGIAVSDNSRMFVIRHIPFCYPDCGIQEQSVADLYENSVWESDMALNAPYGIALDAADKLYIADTGNNVVQVIERDPNQNHHHELITIWGGFLSPRGIAFAPTGQIYITDAGNNRIVVANPLTPYIPVPNILSLIIFTIICLALTLVITIPSKVSRRIDKKYLQFMERRRKKRTRRQAEAKRHREDLARQADMKRIQEEELAHQRQEAEKRLARQRQEAEERRIQEITAQIERIILELAPQFSKLQVGEIAEKCGVLDENLIIKVLQQMIIRK